MSDRSPSVLLVGANELARLKVLNQDLVVIDVRLEDDYSAGHIPDSMNNCVFEVAFLERMEKECPERERSICVYGAHEESFESRFAAEKLLRAGYTCVSEFRGGLAAWKEAGKGVQGAEDAKVPRADAVALPDGDWLLELEESRVGWTGRNLLNRHFGSIALKSGMLVIADGALVSGEVVLDMKGIACDDLAGDKLHDVLIHHLESDDFFDSSRFPEARLSITGSEPLEGGRPGAANLLVRGDLELRGVLKKVEFEAVTGVTADGLPAAQASFSIDRTRWDILYGSGGFFQRLAGHLVNDDIDLELRILAKELKA